MLDHLVGSGLSETQLLAQCTPEQLLDMTLRGSNPHACFKQDQNSRSYLVRRYGSAGPVSICLQFEVFIGIDLQLPTCLNSLMCVRMQIGAANPELQKPIDRSAAGKVNIALEWRVM